MAIDFIGMALSKKFTAETSEGMGAVKGSPCTISSITKEGDTNIVTFSWIDASDVVHTQTMNVVDGTSGADGKSVVSMVINNNAHLIVTLSDNTTIDAGVVPMSTIDGEVVTGGGTYSNPGVKNVVGGVELGQVFDNVPITDVLNMLFEPPYTKPTISIGLSSRNLYDKNGSDIPTTITITANVTKKSKPITEVCAYAGSTLIEKKTTDVANGGAIKFTFTVPANFATTTFKVTCSDGKNSVETTSKVTLVALSYYGCIADGTEINEANIKALTSTLKATVGGTYTYTTTYGRFIHAIPKAVGTLSSAKDLVNNFNYTESCTFTTMTINGENYSVAYLNDAMGFDGVKITYA